MSKRILKYLFSILISAGILFLLLKSVEPRKIFETLSAMDKSLILWFAIFYAGMLVFRTLRYRILFGSTLSFPRLFGIVNVYNFLNEFLPFRSGELVYLYMIKQAGVPVGKNVSSLIVVRLLDFLTVIVLGFSALGILLAGGLRAFGIEKYVWLFPVILVAGLVCFGLFLRFSKAVTGFLLRPFKNISGFGNLAFRIEHLVEDVIGALKNGMQGKTFLKVVLASLGVWVCATASYWLIFRSLGVPLSLIQMFFVIAFPALAVVLPVNSIGNVGTFELPVILGLLALGFSQETALPASLSGHAVSFSLAIVSGLVGLLIHVISSKR